MRKILLLLSVAAVMAMAFAPAAGASIHLCSQNADQQSAQTALDQDPSTASTLDPDGDGTACEDFFGNAQQQPAGGQQEPQQVQEPQQPVQQSQTQPMQDLPDTGGPSVLLAGAALLMGTGIFGLIAVWKRTG